MSTHERRTTAHPGEPGTPSGVLAPESADLSALLEMTVTAARGRARERARRDAVDEHEMAILHRHELERELTALREQLRRLADTSQARPSARKALMIERGERRAEALVAAIRRIEQR